MDADRHMQFSARGLGSSIGMIIAIALSSSVGPAHGSAISEPVAVAVAPGDALAASAANPAGYSIDVSTGSVLISAQPPSTGAADYRLQLKAGQLDPERLFDQPLARSDLVTVDAEVTYGDLARLRVEGNLLEFAAPADDDIFALDEDFGFMNSAGVDWEANRVNDAQLTVALLDDRVRFTSRRASSSYEPSVAYIERATADLEPNRNVFPSRSMAEGEAFLHRLDAEIRRSEDLSISIFGIYSEIAPDYEYQKGWSAESAGISEGESRKLGTALSWSPVDLSLSHERSRKFDGPDEAQYEAGIGINLVDLWPRLGGNDVGPWALAPSSAWASVALGEVGSGTGDRTKSVSFGLSWERSNSYASVDVWDYRYESGSGTYDWAGSGGYAGVSVSGEQWSLDTGFGMYRTDNKETTSRSSDVGFDKSLLLSYRPENLPNLSAGIFSGRYRTDYIIHGGEGSTDLAQFGLTLDFSKFLSASPMKTDRQKLKLMYRFEDLLTNDSYTGNGGDGGHSIGFFYRVNF